MPDFQFQIQITLSKELMCQRVEKHYARQREAQNGDQREYQREARAQ
jgi:hypothetical protein